MNEPNIDEILASFESKIISDVRDAMRGHPGCRTFGVDDDPRGTAEAALEQYVIRQQIAELENIIGSPLYVLGTVLYANITDRIKTLQAKLIKEKEL